MEDSENARHEAPSAGPYIATFRRDNNEVSFKVRCGEELVTSTLLRGVDKHVAAIGLFNTTRGEESISAVSPKLVFWVICVSKSRIWVAEKIKFRCDNEENLRREIVQALRGGVSYSPLSPVNYASHVRDIVTYHGKFYSFCTMETLVGVKIQKSKDSSLESALVFKWSQPSGSRKEIEVGDYCTFGSTKPRASKSAPNRK